MSDPKPLPRAQPVPSALIEQWIDMPGDGPLGAALTKDDLDNLYIAINSLTKAVYETQKSLSYLSNNNLDFADDAIHKAQFNTVQSTNALTRFLEGIITQHLAMSKARHET